MKLGDLLHILQDLAPEETALDGDPVGLLIQPAMDEITSVLVCLDATAHVAAAARNTEAQLIVTHHPLIYNPLRRLERSDPIGAVAISLVERGIGLHAMHTNWDAAKNGINDTLAAKIGLTGVKTLTGGAEAYLGRIGTLTAALPQEQFLSHVQEALGCNGTSALRHLATNGKDRSISKVAVCGGAGAMLVPDVIAAGAQAFVTADVRHHEFIDAAARGLLLIDAGHEATEAPGMQTLAQLLAASAPGLKVEFCANWE